MQQPKKITKDTITSYYNALLPQSQTFEEQLLFKQTAIQKLKDHHVTLILH